MASKVEVLLRDNIKPLGKCGDVVMVTPGYARNYLFPRKLALEATAENKKAMAKRRAKLDEEEAKRTIEIMALVAAIQGTSVKTIAKADDTGHLYGSVNAGQIVELLAAAGHKVEEKAVKLAAPIKLVGTHAVKIHVHGEHDAEITVVVEAEAAPAS
jgi:large subunit ribosomal protein L9